MIQKHICSCELSKKLKEIGVKQTNNLFYWYSYKQNDKQTKELVFPADLLHEDIAADISSAFIATELLELLPIKIIQCEENYYFNFEKKIKSYWVYYRSYFDSYEGDIGEEEIENKNLCDALAEMLIYLYENKLMEIK